MKLGEFEIQLAVSALVCAAAALSGSIGGFSLPFALALLALSQAGYFSLSAIKKANLRSPGAEYLLAAMAFACFFVASLYFSSLSILPALLFVPITFCTPAAVAASRQLFSG